MAHDDQTNRSLTQQEREALQLFRMMSPSQRAMTIGWMSHRASAPKGTCALPRTSNEIDREK